MFPTADPITSAAPALSLRIREVAQIEALLHTEEGATDDGRHRSAGRLADGEWVAAAQSGRPANTGTVANGAGQAAARGLSPLPGNAAVLPSAQMPVLAAGTEESVSLGSMARTLATLAPQFGSTSATLPLPALDATVTDTPRFAVALARAVGGSGAFYESHLRDWVEGQRTLDAIRAEPRAQTVATPAAPQPAPADATPRAPVEARAPMTAADIAGPPFKAEPITMAQLRCAETNEMHFSLQVWPGQPAELLLRTPERPPQHGHQPHAEPPPPGSGTLRMTLPLLGNLEAKIRTDGTQVRITLATPDTAISQQLRGATAALADGMGSAGLTLVSTTIHEHAA